MVGDYTEESLVEQPAIALFEELGWEAANCFYESFTDSPSPVSSPKGRGIDIGRETPYDVVLEPKLRVALGRLNPGIADEAINFTIEELTKDRGLMSPAQANREVYRLLKNGVKVPGLGDKDDEPQTVKVIDWENPTNNDFFLASQFWISGEMYKRRADLVGFVNGIPLVFIELKAFHKNLEDAFQDNLRDYKTTISQIFWYNAFIILSNGSDSRIGTITAEWEHFAEWKKINSEGEEGVVSQSQNEVPDLKNTGVDITPHRKRMVKEDLDEKFKDPKDPFRIVFVCAMWMTGFDVPSCSTIYLDKPMRNHTLMQTIARANRVFKDKVNGLIVDYVGVFRDLQKALAIYDSASGGGIQEGDTPIKDKDALIGLLKETQAAAMGFCAEHGIELVQIQAADGYVIKDPAEKFGGERWVDLSQIDFKALKAQFDKGRKRVEIEKLKAAIQAKLAQMVARNKSRLDYLEKFQRMIEEYNAGSYNTELFFKKLMDFAKELNEEEKTGIAEQLNEEELAIFDLLTKPEISLAKKEKTQVKKVARELLATLKNGKLVLDWRKRQQGRAAVRLCIMEILEQLPKAYTADVYETKCDAVYQHVYDSYYAESCSVYAAVN